MLFFEPDLTTFRVNRTREFHHWHPGSETVATASQLYSTLMRGWAVSQHVNRTEVRFRGGRRTWLYKFDLQYNDHYMTMPVQANPAVERFVHTEAFIVTEQQHVAEVSLFAANA